MRDCVLFGGGVFFSLRGAVEVNVILVLLGLVVWLIQLGFLVRVRGLVPDQDKVSSLKGFSPILGTLGLLPCAVLNNHRHALLFKGDVGDLAKLRKMRDAVVALALLEAGDAQLTRATVQRGSLGEPGRPRATTLSLF